MPRVRSAPQTLSSPDGQWLVAWTKANGLWVHDLSLPKPVAHSLSGRGPGFVAGSAAFSQDGRWVAADGQHHIGLGPRRRLPSVPPCRSPVSVSDVSESLSVPLRAAVVGTRAVGTRAACRLDTHPALGHGQRVPSGQRPAARGLGELPGLAKWSADGALGLQR